MKYERKFLNKIVALSISALLPFLPSQVLAYSTNLGLGTSNPTNITANPSSQLSQSASGSDSAGSWNLEASLNTWTINMDIASVMYQGVDSLGALADEFTISGFSGTEYVDGTLTFTWDGSIDVIDGYLGENSARYSVFTTVGSMLSDPYYGTPNPALFTYGEGGYVSNDVTVNNSFTAHFRTSAAAPIVRLFGQMELGVGNAARADFFNTFRLSDVYLPQGYSYTAASGFQFPPLAAVPEPETYAMLLAGLGLLGFTAKRRKQGA